MNWRENPKIRIVVVIMAVNAYLLFGRIMPSHERIPYYRNQIEELKQERQLLRNNLTHLNYYLEKQPETEEELRKLEASIDGIKNNVKLQTFYNNLYNKHGLQVLQHQTGNAEPLEDIEIITVQQKLEGTYEKLIRYLEDFSNQNTLAILSSCTMVNTSPLETDPNIILSIEQSYYLPKLQ